MSFDSTNAPANDNDMSLSSIEVGNRNISTTMVFGGAGNRKEYRFLDSNRVVSVPRQRVHKEEKKKVKPAASPKGHRALVHRKSKDADVRNSRRSSVETMAKNKSRQEKRKERAETASQRDSQTSASTAGEKKKVREDHSTLFNALRHRGHNRNSSAAAAPSHPTPTNSSVAARSTVSSTVDVDVDVPSSSARDQQGRPAIDRGGGGGGDSRDSSLNRTVSTIYSASHIFFGHPHAGSGAPRGAGAAPPLNSTLSSTTKTSSSSASGRRASGDQRIDALPGITNANGSTTPLKHSVPSSSGKETPRDKSRRHTLPATLASVGPTSSEPRSSSIPNIPQYDVAFFTTTLDASLNSKDARAELYRATPPPPPPPVLRGPLPQPPAQQAPQPERPQQQQRPSQGNESKVGQGGAPELMEQATEPFYSPMSTSSLHIAPPPPRDCLLQPHPSPTAPQETEELERPATAPHHAQGFAPATAADRDGSTSAPSAQGTNVMVIETPDNLIFIRSSTDGKRPPSPLPTAPMDANDSVRVEDEPSVIPSAPNMPNPRGPTQPNRMSFAVPLPPTESIHSLSVDVDAMPPALFPNSPGSSFASGNPSNAVTSQSTSQQGNTSLSKEEEAQLRKRSSLKHVGNALVSTSGIQKANCLHYYAKYYADIQTPEAFTPKGSQGTNDLHPGSYSSSNVIFNYGKPVSPLNRSPNAERLRPLSSPTTGPFTANGANGMAYTSSNYLQVPNAHSPLLPPGVGHTSPHRMSRHSLNGSCSSVDSSAPPPPGFLHQQQPSYVAPLTHNSGGVDNRDTSLASLTSTSSGNNSRKYQRMRTLLNAENKKHEVSPALSRYLKRDEDLKSICDEMECGHPERMQLAVPSPPASRPPPPPFGVVVGSPHQDNLFDHVNNRSEVLFQKLPERRRSTSLSSGGMQSSTPPPGKMPSPLPQLSNNNISGGGGGTHGPTPSSIDISSSSLTEGGVGGAGAGAGSGGGRTGNVTPRSAAEDSGMDKNERSMTVLKHTIPAREFIKNAKTNSDKRSCSKSNSRILN